MGDALQADPHALSAKDLVKTLSRVMKRPRMAIGPDLARALALWAEFMRGRNFSGGTDDWFVRFLRWALADRARDFIAWATAHPSPECRIALSGIQQVYDFRWPHNASCGYTFHAMWGWLQLELEKPGEKKPSSIAEQMEQISRAFSDQGKRVKAWIYLGPGGVMGIPEDDPDDLPKVVTAR